MNLKYGVTEWSLPGKGLFAVNLAAACGLDSLQVGLGDYEDGFRLSQDIIQENLLFDAQKYNIEIASMALNALGAHGFTKDNENKKIAYLTLEKGIEAAHKMNIASVTLPSFADNAIKTPDDFKMSVEAFKYCCDLAAKYNIDVYTENVLLPEELFDLFRKVDAENFYVLYDSQNYHVLKNLDQAQILYDIKDHIGNILHVKDGTGSMSNHYLGEGNSCFFETAEIIKKIDFNGTIILEDNYFELAVENDNERIQSLVKDLDILKTTLEKEK